MTITGKQRYLITAARQRLALSGRPACFTPRAPLCGSLIRMENDDESDIREVRRMAVWPANISKINAAGARTLNASSLAASRRRNNRSISENNEK